MSRRYVRLPARLVVAEPREKVEAEVAALDGLAHAEEQCRSTRPHLGIRIVEDGMQGIEPLLESAAQQAGDGNAIEQQQVDADPQRAARGEELSEELDSPRRARDGRVGAGFPAPGFDGPIELEEERRRRRIR